jgi:phage host-nuclease inhibitor protein Gam
MMKVKTRAISTAAWLARVTALQREVTDADDKLKRLYQLVEDGMTEMDDVLKDRLNSLKADRDRAKAALERARSHSSQAIRIDPALLEQFGRSMRENFTSGSIPFRKAYLQSLIDGVEVDDAQIRIKGSKDVLERAVLASRHAATSGSRAPEEIRTFGLHRHVKVAASMTLSNCLCPLHATGMRKWGRLIVVYPGRQIDRMSDQMTGHYRHRAH